MENNNRNICTLCSSRANDRSYFGFPKNEQLKRKWIEFCELETVTKNAKLCNLHFETEDIMTTDKMRKLKKGRVPSIYFDEFNISRIKIQNVSTTSDLMTTTNDLMPTTSDPTLTISDPTLTSSDPMPTISESMPAISDSMPVSNVNDARGIIDDSSLKKYLGNVTTDDLATPEIALKYIKKSITMLEGKNKEIRLLKQQNKRLKKKVENFFDLMVDLQKRCLLSEKSANEIMVGSSNW